MITAAELQRAREWAQTDHGRATMQAQREELRALLRSDRSVEPAPAGMTRGE